MTKTQPSDPIQVRTYTGASPALSRGFTGAASTTSGLDPRSGSILRACAPRPTPQ